MVVIILRALKHRDRPHLNLMTKGQKKYEPAPIRVFEMYENQIIPMLAEGYNYAEIAEQIPPLNEKLVINYSRLIQEKWEAKNRPNLIHLWHLKQKSNA